jgi:hypothetical protein
MPETAPLNVTYNSVQVAVDPAAVMRMRARPGLSDSDLIQHGLQFANTGHMDESLLWVTQIVASGAQGVVERLVDLGLDQREAFREALAALVSNEVTSQMVELWERRASGLLLLPTVQMRDSKRLVTFRYLCVEFFDTPPDPLFAYLLLLFLDSARSYGKDLCQCRLLRCSRFFLADRSQPHRPRTRFCTEKHYEEFRDADAVRRVQESRANRKKRAKQRKHK